MNMTVGQQHTLYYMAYLDREAELAKAKEEKKEAERKLAQDKVRAAEEDIQRQNGVRVPARLRQRPQVPAQQQMPNISSSMLEDLADELS